MDRSLYSGDFKTQAFFHKRINSFQQIFPPEIGTGFVMRKILTLLRSRHMNRTPLVQLSVVQKNTGTVIFNLEGISFLNKPLPHLTVTELEVAGYSVDIGGGNEKNRTW